MNLITVSREFGSGGRELGKRLAEHLGYAYYDREILTLLAEETALNEEYLDRVLERGAGMQSFAISIGHTFAAQLGAPQLSANLLARQTQLMKELAQRGNCVIVGRNANVILSELEPLRLFVHAEMPARIARCRARAPEGEQLTDRQYEKNIRQVDRERAKLHDMLCSYDWSDVRGYDLCINTSYRRIKDLIPALGMYAEAWFTGRGERTEQQG